MAKRIGSSPLPDTASAGISPKISFRSCKIRKLSSAAKPPQILGSAPTASDSPSASPQITRPLSFAGEIDLALRHLRRSDSLLAGVIDAFQPPVFETSRRPFLSLARSILYQQLAIKAAKSIYTRFLALCGGEDGVLPGTVLALTSEQLRHIGISGRKASYLHDLAAKFEAGPLSESSILEMDDATLLEMLTAVKGIGVWSVHMFMIFSLHKPDVLPVGDLGVRRGVQQLYGLKVLPQPTEMERICEKWRPYRSVGSWYMWRFMEAKGVLPNAEATGTS